MPILTLLFLTRSLQSKHIWTLLTITRDGTERQREIAITRLNRPRGQFSEKDKILLNHGNNVKKNTKNVNFLMDIFYKLIFFYGLYNLNTKSSQPVMAVDLKF